MYEKKGFFNTYGSLLLKIVIGIGVLLFLIFISRLIWGLLFGGNKELKEMEKSLLTSSQLYFRDSPYYLPEDTKEKVTVSLETLYNYGYVPSMDLYIKDNVVCTGYVDVVKKSNKNDDYKYSPFIKCGTLFKTKKYNENRNPGLENPGLSILDFSTVDERKISNKEFIATGSFKNPSSIAKYRYTISSKNNKDEKYIFEQYGSFIEDGSNFEINVSKEGYTKAKIEVYDVNGTISTHYSDEYIIDTVPPVISGVKDHEIDQNDSFNPLEGINASDNLSGKINFTVDGKVETQTYGEYKLIYNAVDEAGNVASVSRIVSVRNLSNELTNISVNAGELSPSFKSNTTSYEVAVPEDVETIKFTVIPNSSRSEVTINSSKNITEDKKLKVGSNKFEIKVTKDNKTMIYTVVVTRGNVSSSNPTTPTNPENPDESGYVVSFLTNLSVAEGQISPSFSADNLEYRVSVPSSVSKITINTSTDPASKTKVSLPNNTTLTSTQTTFEITATAADGSFRIYKIIVTTSLPSENGLSSLSVSKYQLNTEFDSEMTNYSVRIPYSEKSIKVNATAKDSKALVDGAKEYSLISDETKVYVNVVAQDGSIRTYTIDVVRETEISGLLAGISLDKGELIPSFDPTVLSYIVNVPVGTEYITVTPILKDERANVMESKKVKLIPGDNLVEIPIKVEGKIVTTYTVKINLSASNISLKSLAVSGANLTPAFSPNVYEYTAVVPKEYKNFTVVAGAEDETSTVSGTGTYDLTVNSKNAVVSVIGKDKTKKDYIITVKKSATNSSSAGGSGGSSGGSGSSSGSSVPNGTEAPSRVISSLSIEGGTISPAFHPDVTEYTLTVQRGNSISLAPVSKDNQATIYGNTGLNTIIPASTVEEIAKTEGKIKIYVKRDGLEERVYNFSLILSDKQVVENIKLTYYECSKDNSCVQRGTTVIAACGETASRLSVGNDINAVAIEYDNTLNGIIRKSIMPRKALEPGDNVITMMDLYTGKKLHDIIITKTTKSASSTELIYASVTNANNSSESVMCFNEGKTCSVALSSTNGKDMSASIALTTDSLDATIESNGVKRENKYTDTITVKDGQTVSYVISTPDGSKATYKIIFKMKNAGLPERMQSIGYTFYPANGGTAISGTASIDDNRKANINVPGDGSILLKSPSGFLISQTASAFKDKVALKNSSTSITFTATNSYNKSSSYIVTVTKSSSSSSSNARVDNMFVLSQNKSYIPTQTSQGDCNYNYEVTIPESSSVTTVRAEVSNGKTFSGGGVSYAKDFLLSGEFVDRITVRNPDGKTETTCLKIRKGELISGYGDVYVNNKKITFDSSNLGTIQLTVPHLEKLPIKAEVRNASMKYEITYSYVLGDQNPIKDPKLDLINVVSIRIRYTDVNGQFVALRGVSVMGISDKPVPGQPLIAAYKLYSKEPYVSGTITDEPVILEFSKQGQNEPAYYRYSYTVGNNSSPSAAQEIFPGRIMIYSGDGSLVDRKYTVQAGNVNGVGNSATFVVKTTGRPRVDACIGEIDGEKINTTKISVDAVKPFCAVGTVTLVDTKKVGADYCDWLSGLKKGQETCKVKFKCSDGVVKEQTFKLNYTGIKAC